MEEELFNFSLEAPMEKCLHVLAGPDGLCLDCDAPTSEETTPRLTAEEYKYCKNKVEGDNSNPDFLLTPGADIVGICRLAELVILEYADELERHQDPDNPELPRIRMIGGVIYRPDWTEFWKSLVTRSYLGALTLGYCQTLERWDQFLKETVQYKIATLAEEIQCQKPGNSHS